MRKLTAMLKFAPAFVTGLTTRMTDQLKNALALLCGSEGKWRGRTDIQ